MIRNTKISVLSGLTFLALLMLSGLSFIAAQAQVYPEPKAAPALNRPHLEPAGATVPPMFVPNVAQVAARRDSISLSPVADTYVASGRPDREWDDEDWFWVGYELPNYQIQRTLLKFDVSEIPVETDINSATLSLFMSQATSNGDMKIEVYRLGSDWPENITWSEQTDLLVDATPVEVSEVSTQSGWYEWDVSPLVQEWVDDPSSNFGIILKGDESVGQHGRKFWSRECNPAKCESNLPKLDVEFGVATPTPTDTPTPTATKTPRPTNTPGPSPTHTPTPAPPSKDGDAYEPDDSCAQASTIPTDGTIQRHNFHQSGDTDWVRFEGTAGTEYLVEAQVPADSLANVSLVIYDKCGGGKNVGSQNKTFSATVRMQFTAPSDGPFFLELYNDPREVAGSNVLYNLSVRTLSQSGTPGALIIVAGLLRSNDPLQDNIHFVTDAVYDLFGKHNYTDDDINYLATDPDLAGFDASATKQNLQHAITTWARDKVGPDRALTLYLMDHGDQNRLYLDKPRREWVTDEELDRWLSDLEAARPGVKINVIIEACYTGSFIEGAQTVSGPGRVVITSTGSDNLAWASDEGAVFSDHFLAALGRKSSLYTSFQEASEAIESTRRPQTPWLDGNGDGVPNEADDVTEAAKRGFAHAGTFDEEQWPPYIAEAPVPVVKDGRAEIKSEVLDDIKVDQVWAVIYPPSYQAPEATEELIEESLQTTLLLDQGNDWYGATYPGFNESGTYRIVIYAKDEDGLKARPVTIEVKVEPDPPLGVYQLYLPIAIR